jgi:hypothetical protein
MGVRGGTRRYTEDTQSYAEKRLVTQRYTEDHGVARRKKEHRVTLRTTEIRGELLFSLFFSAKLCVSSAKLRVTIF